MWLTVVIAAHCLFFFLKNRTILGSETSTVFITQKKIINDQKKKWKDIQLHLIREIQIKIKYLIFAHNTGQKEGKDFVIQCWQGLRRRHSPSKSVGVQIGTVIWAAIWHIHQILKYITLDLETPLLKMCPTESLPQSPKDVYMPKSVH